MAKTTACLSSLHGLDVDTLLSAEEIEGYVGHSDFQELAGMVLPGSRFTLWNILQQLMRRGVRTEILNKIIEGVRGSSPLSSSGMQGRIEELQAEIAFLKEELARCRSVREREKGVQGGAAKKTDEREIKSMAKICSVLLVMAGKDLSDAKTRAGIKRKLDEADMHLDDKTAKKYFDMIRDVMKNNQE